MSAPMPLNNPRPTHGNRAACAGGSKGVGVALVDDDTEPADARGLVARVCHVGHRRARRVRLGLDAQGLVVVDNGVVLNGDARHGRVAADGTLQRNTTFVSHWSPTHMGGNWAYDGDTVSAGAGVALEDDVAALVDREAVVLVHDRAVLDHEVRRAAVEAVGVVSRGLASALGVGLVAKSWAKH